MDKSSFLVLARGIDKDFPLDIVNLIYEYTPPYKALIYKYTLKIVAYFMDEIVILTREDKSTKIVIRSSNTMMENNTTKEEDHGRSADIMERFEDFLNSITKPADETLQSLDVFFKKYSRQDLTNIIFSYLSEALSTEKDIRDESDRMNVAFTSESSFSGLGGDLFNYLSSEYGILHNQNMFDNGVYVIIFINKLLSKIKKEFCIYSSEEYCPSPYIEPYIDDLVYQ